MKPLTLLLVLSLAATATFVTVALHSKSGPLSNIFSIAKISHGAETGGKTDGAAAATSASAVNAKTWSNLQTSDLKTLVERLRAAGFPSSVIRSIISSQISERYTVQRKALLANQGETPYWQRPAYAYDAKVMAALRDSYRQQMKDVKELLGPDADSASDVDHAWQRRQYGDLPADKLEQMQSIVSDYSDLRNEIYAKANGVLLPEDREKLALLEKEQHADLAAALTPEELENYELRSSATANAIRSQLSIFKPTEQEFRGLFDATRAAEAQYGALTSSGAANMEQVGKIRAAVLADLQNKMSPERYAELEEATDPKYQMTNRLVARLDLPASTAVAVVAIQQDTQQRLAELRRDTSLSADQRSAQVAVLAQDVTGKLTNALTPTGFEAYKQYGGGWLQNLKPPVKAPKAP